MVYICPTYLINLVEAWLDILLYGFHDKQLVSLIPNSHLASTGSSEEKRLLAADIHTHQWALHICLKRNAEVAMQVELERSSPGAYCTVGRLRQICYRLDG